MTHRLNIEFDEKEIESIENWQKLARLRTKREFVTNAIALFKWAAREALDGRSLASVNRDGSIATRFETPALSTIAELFDVFPPISEEERTRRRAPAGRPLPDSLDEVLGHAHETDGEGASERPAVSERSLT